AFGARVPGRDEALGIEHEDRVVPDAVDEHAEALLAPPHLLLGAPPLAEIARDLREPVQLAGLVAQRGDHDVGPEPRAILANAPALVLDTAFERRAPEQLAG